MKIKKKMPLFLRTWLYLMGISTVINFLRNAYLISDFANYQNISSTLTIMFLILMHMILVLISIKMILSWKKAGFFIILVVSVVMTLLDLALGLSTYEMPQLSVYAIAGLAGITILYLAMRPVWNNFK